MRCPTELVHLHFAVLQLYCDQEVKLNDVVEVVGILRCTTGAVRV